MIGNLGEAPLSKKPANSFDEDNLDESKLREDAFLLKRFRKG